MCGNKNANFFNQSVLWLDGENPDAHLLLQNLNSERLSQIVGPITIVVIEEAQKINNVGSVLKLFAHYHKKNQVIARDRKSVV